MKQLKLFLALIFCFTLMLSLTSCGNDAIETEEDIVDIRKNKIYKRAQRTGYNGSEADWEKELLDSIVIMKIEDQNLLWRYAEDDDFILLFSLEKLLGLQSDKFELNISLTQVEWRLKEKTDWETLFSLEELKGNDGIVGKSVYDLALEFGFKGTFADWLKSLQSKDIEFKVIDDVIKWHYIYISNWTNLLPLASVEAEVSKDAYDNYLNNHLEYRKTYEEWLDDFINIRLGNLEIYTVKFITHLDTLIKEQKVVDGSKLQEPEKLSKEGYQFLGFYLGDKKWNFESDIVKDNLTLEANFKEYVKFTMNDFEFSYNGLEHILKVNEELPEGYEITYINNEQVEIGSYDVTAIVKVDGLEIQRLSSKLNIKIGDFKDVKFRNKFFNYDGKEKCLEMTSALPKGAEVVYVNNKHTEIGKYQVTATLSGKNYETTTLEAIMIIKEGVVTIRDFVDNDYAEPKCIHGIITANNSISGKELSSFVISDETGSIFCFDKTYAFNLGDEVIISGVKKIYQDLVEITDVKVEEYISKNADYLDITGDPLVITLDELSNMLLEGVDLSKKYTNSYLEIHAKIDEKGNPITKQNLDIRFYSNLPLLELNKENNVIVRGFVRRYHKDHKALYIMAQSIVSAEDLLPLTFEIKYKDLKFIPFSNTGFYHLYDVELTKGEIFTLTINGLKGKVVTSEWDFDNNLNENNEIRFSGIYDIEVIFDQGKCLVSIPINDKAQFKYQEYEFHKDAFDDYWITDKIHLKKGEKINLTLNGFDFKGIRIKSNTNNLLSDGTIHNDAYDSILIEFKNHNYYVYVGGYELAEGDVVSIESLYGDIPVNFNVTIRGVIVAKNKNSYILSDNVVEVRLIFNEFGKYNVGDCLRVYGCLEIDSNNNYNFIALDVLEIYPFNHYKDSISTEYIHYYLEDNPEMPAVYHGLAKIIMENNELYILTLNNYKIKLQDLKEEDRGIYKTMLNDVRDFTFVIYDYMNEELLGIYVKSIPVYN